MNSESNTVTASASIVSTVDNSPAIVATLPTVTVNGAVLSKKDALALPANKGISRSAVEKAILAEWKSRSVASAAYAGAAAARCAATGGIVTLRASKTGRETITLIPAKVAKKETAKVKESRLLAELAVTRIELATLRADAAANEVNRILSLASFTPEELATATVRAEKARAELAALKS